MIGEAKYVTSEDKMPRYCKNKGGLRLSLGLLVCCLSGYLSGQVQGANQAHSAVSSSASDTTSTVKPATVVSEPGNKDYVIGNDDVLAVNVWKEADFTRSTQVRPDGKISLPLMGEIQAAGRTPSQLEQDITTALQSYLAKPKVTVIVEQINSKKFNILGQVTKPGSYSLTLAPTVMDAIAVASGLRDFAKQKDIYILRRNSQGAKTRFAFNYKDYIKGKNLDQNIRLEPDDTIVVP